MQQAMTKRVVNCDRDAAAEGRSAAMSRSASDVMVETVTSDQQIKSFHSPRLVHRARTADLRRKTWPHPHRP